MNEFILRNSQAFEKVAATVEVNVGTVVELFILLIYTYSTRPILSVPESTGEEPAPHVLSR